MSSPPPAPPPPLPPVSGSGLKKCGYLRKQKHGHRRFFVLREATERGPARLEYYESEKKFRGGAAARRGVALDSCLCVSKRADAKHKHLVALYTRDEYFAVAADSEREQEAWFRVLSELVSEGRGHVGCTSSLVGFEESPAPSFREVWQVTVKARGLGGARGLTGVCRLCLSRRAISFVRLSSDAAALSLQLSNVRRCGHSDSFFFVEVGRSAVTGPGELWMQAEDPVVAQSIHETVLEAMRAMKEPAEFRPRSKSQSAGTKPISVPVRRARPPPPLAGGKFPAPCRVRTASEGDGGGGGAATRPVSISFFSTSPTAGGRTCRMLELDSEDSSPRLAGGGVPASTTGSSSPRSGGGVFSPIGSSPRIGGGVFTPVGGSSPRVWGGFSVSGSPGNGEDYCAGRCGTPDSLSGSTPPSSSGSTPSSCSSFSYRQRTHSLTTPRRRPQQLSSASLDECSLTRFGNGSPKVRYPEDYGDVEIGMSRSSSGNVADDGGYVAMTPGAVAADYVPMSPMCVSEPQQIVNRRKCGGSPDDGGYVRMWCGFRASASPDGDYMNMSPGSRRTPPDHDDYDQYVLMSPQSLRQREADSVPMNRGGRPSRYGRSPLDSVSEHPISAEPWVPGHYSNLEEDGIFRKDSPGAEENDHGYTEMTFGLNQSPRQLVAHNTGRAESPDQRLELFLLGPSPPRPSPSPAVVRAERQGRGRRRHSSDTFAPAAPSLTQRHSSAENVSARSSDVSDDDLGPAPCPSPRLSPDYIALNLPGDNLLGFKLHREPIVCLGFKEVKD